MSYSKNQNQNQLESSRSQSINNNSQSNQAALLFGHYGSEQSLQGVFGHQHPLHGPNTYTQPGHAGGPPQSMQQPSPYQSFQHSGPGRNHEMGHLPQPMQPPHGYVQILGAAPRPCAASHMPSNFNDRLPVNMILPTSSMIPGAARVSEAQLTIAYGYGFYDKTGGFVRLVPADTLRSRTTPYPQIQGPEGLIILPRPRSYSPQQRADHTDLHDHMVPVALVNQVYEENVRNIDSFGRDKNGNVVRDATQTTIDSIVNNALAPPPRRQKVFCDKWIHEGVCAFTQLGCKYKHEMPSDKATQMSLGLGHGYPKWYKDKMSMGARSPPSGLSAGQTTIGSSPGRRTMSTSWRSIDAVVSGPAPVNGGNASGFGPIAPPSTNPVGICNPYSALARVKSSNSNDGRILPRAIEEEENGNEATFKVRRSSIARHNSYARH